MIDEIAPAVSAYDVAYQKTETLNSAFPEALKKSILQEAVQGIMSPVKTSALAVAGTKPAEGYRIHTVIHGDTLWAIAKKYLGNGSRYNEIVSLHGLKSNVIYSGMKLKIPNK